LPPQHALERVEVSRFQDGESLYRRYLASHFQDGELDPSAIRFDEPPSFLRSAFSLPEDAIHPDCADGKDVSNYGVLKMQASEAQHQEKARNGSAFDFTPVHRPLPSCYAHSEIHCSCAANLEGKYSEPPKDVRKAFRLRIARALSVAIPAP
jgi:hypothetical protein